MGIQVMNFEPFYASNDKRAALLGKRLGRGCGDASSSQENMTMLIDRLQKDFPFYRRSICIECIMCFTPASERIFVPKWSLKFGKEITLMAKKMEILSKTIHLGTVYSTHS